MKSILVSLFLSLTLVGCSHFKKCNKEGSCKKEHQQKEGCAKEGSQSGQDCAEKCKKEKKDCNSAEGGCAKAGGAHTGLVLPDMKAKAIVNPLQKKSKIKGVITIDPAEGHGSKMRVELSGLVPNQKHGFHIHEFGDCSAADGSSAGGHFNPSGKPHGAGGPESHVGDLGNVQADAKGNAIIEIPLHVNVYNYLGRSVIVHAKADDLQSQPAGGAGDRVACGVIGLTQ